MTQKIDGLELRRLRNDIPIRDVVYALKVPWKMDDQLCRFKCPNCGSLDTSLHPKENLGRCFSCQRNFNPIDLVSTHLGVGFRGAVDWLQRLFNIMQSKEYGLFINAQRRASEMS
jgi:hypothetical protein